MRSWRRSAGVDVANQQFLILGEKPDLGVFVSMSSYNYLRRKAARMAAAQPATAPTTAPTTARNTGAAATQGRTRAHCLRWASELTNKTRARGPNAARSLPAFPCLHLSLIPHHPAARI